LSSRKIVWIINLKALAYANNNDNFPEITQALALSMIQAISIEPNLRGGTMSDRIVQKCRSVAGDGTVRINWGKIILPIVCMAFVVWGCSKSPTNSEVKDSRNYNFTVTNNSSSLIANALVQIPTGSGSYSANTGSDGKCHISIPNTVTLPTYVVATIDNAQYMPEATTVLGQSDQNANRSIRCASPPNRFYVREVGLHHLGNDNYDGSANSQLQLPSQGTSVSFSFYLDQAPGLMPYIRIYARGIEYPTRIKINGYITNTLGNSASNGDLSFYSFRLSGNPAQYFKSGNNVLTIETAPTGLSNDPLDDMEFCALAMYNN
jgi:hypothetical protein